MKLQTTSFLLNLGMEFLTWNPYKCGYFIMLEVGNSSFVFNNGNQPL